MKVCISCRRPVVPASEIADPPPVTAHGWVHEHSGVQFCDAERPGLNRAKIKEDDNAAPSA